MTLTELQAQLAIVEAQLIETKKYSIVGSHSVENGDFDSLNKQASLLRKRIYRYQGYTGRTVPDFSTGSSNYAKDY